MTAALIKREPIRRGASPASPCAGRTNLMSNSPATLRASQRIARHPAPPTVASTGTLPYTDNRHARSGAPSIDTRPATAHNRADDDGDEIVFLETRVAQPKVKPDPDADRPAVEPSPAVAVANDSLLNRNFQKIASNVKALGETLGKLQSLGIQHVASLPSLVLVGDQSSGKSTLMSGIAGISLPHREGMCTRCPVHIRLSQSNTWQCTISLQQDFSYDGDVSTVGGRQPRLTKDKEFGPWSPQPRATYQFWSCKDKNDDKIKTAIRWAQVAILNPNHDHRHFAPSFPEGFDLMQEEARLDQHELEAVATFSPNTVALDISGPNLTDLSFYDLPGLIKTPKQEKDEYLVKVVENLAKKYISDQNAIILWAVPMNADPENSSTLHVIRKQKAQPRTVGIMTKADLLPQSSRNYEQWLHMLRGEQHHVGHSFFITSRQPGQDNDRQNSFEEAFFNRAKPGANATEPAEESGLWPKAFEDYNHRCGLNSLVVFLSETLRRAFVNGLPDIVRLVEERLSMVDAELSTLPGAPENPYAELKEGLMTFMSDLRQSLSGGDFVNAWGPLTNKFSDKIILLKPRYDVRVPGQPLLPESTPVTPSTNNRGSPMVVDLSDDATVVGGSSFSQRRNFQDFADGQRDLAAGTPKRPRLGMGGGSFVKREEEEMSQAGTIRNGNGAVVRPGQKKNLANVRARIRNKMKHGVPDITPTEVYEELSLEAIVTWEDPLRIFVTEFVRLLRNKLQELLTTAFKALRNKAVFRECKKHLDDFVNINEASLKEDLFRLFAREKRRMYTLDVDSMHRNRADEEVLLKRHRHWCRWSAHQLKRGKEAPDRPKAWKDMTADEQREEETRMNKEGHLLGEDTYSQELKVLAYVRGYYLTAARRFVDSVALAVVSEFIPSVVHQLATRCWLEMKLDLINGGMNRIDALMSEEPEVAAKRRKLQDEQKKLAAAMESIRKLETAGDDAAEPIDVSSFDSRARDARSGAPSVPTESLDHEMSDYI